ncbi:hypothetical protein V496_04601 [Pseudogymnoascus sp. VKM F-4515 (FW-2607)]|nr:hypothetical protein V496_04601 [Pseudogymnoascus sp. VKM F-4515 (FW-2607)]KFY96553.1 hypothetical protein V498_02609 [Pseudogymnoascus sp. VKM F-4517 (FW-2822)]
MKVAILILALCAVVAAVPTSVAAPVINAEVIDNDLKLGSSVEVALDGVDARHSSRRGDESEVEIELDLGSTIDSEVEIELGQGSSSDSEVEIELGLGPNINKELKITT